MATLGLSWALAQTVEGALNISREAALAAFDDNIQPLALLACEKFGATLAISSFTQRKIEAMLRKQAATPVQKFFQVKIGYAKGGSIGALSSSSGGIRFLCLASALVSGSSNFDAAIALESMIRDTAEDKAMSPTLYQLKDLLDVLEPRLNRARFLDEVAGYQALLLDSQQKPQLGPIVVPSSPAIQMMVESFRELARIGTADAQSLKITVGAFAPWIAAFARWSTEVPPIVSDDQGHILIDQPHSQVTVCISADAKYWNNIEIETIYAYNSIQKVVSAVVDDQSWPTRASGMVSFETYARLTLQDCGFYDGLGARACLQALPCCIHYVKAISEQANPDVGQFEFQNVKQKKHLFQKVKQKKDMDLHFFSPFPSDAVINVVMKKFLHTTENVSIHPLPAEALTFTDLPQVKACVEYYAGQNTYLEEDFRKHIIKNFSHIVADILAFSLLLPEGVADEETIDLLVRYPGNDIDEFPDTEVPCAQAYIERVLEDHVAKSSSRFHPSTARKDELQTLAPSMMDAGVFVNWALCLVGHEVNAHFNSGSWVASSYQGQVIMPCIIIADKIPKSGFACLVHFPGTLMLETQKDRKFSLILSTRTLGKEPVFSVPDSITAQYNICPKETIKWRLTSKAEHLELSIGWTGDQSTFHPLSIISNLPYSLMLASCGHSVDAELVSQDSIEFTAPGHRPGAFSSQNSISVYPLYGNENLKMFVIASGACHPTSIPLLLVNRGACINCAISVCRSIGCENLIL